MVLPAPVAPTSATVWPAGMSRLELVQHRPVGDVAELDAVERDPPRAGRGSGVGATGSGTLGGSASTAAIFSSAAVADCSEL